MNKLILILISVVFMFSSIVGKAYAIPTISGRVVLQGTNAPLPNVWVRWREDFGTPYEFAYRYTQTDASGNYSFIDLAGEPPGLLDKYLGYPGATGIDMIDTNSDGSNDDYEVYYDPTRPIPGFPSGADIYYHFDANNSPHAFTGVVPAGLSGTFNVVDGININDADSSMALPDIVFTPSAVASASPTPVPTYSISGIVFDDDNGNGVKESSETGYSGATINLTGDDSQTVNTDSSGNYSFTGLVAGSYTVAIVAETGYNVTTPSSADITLSSNQTVNFGLEKAVIGAGCTASIRGTVYNDLNWDGNHDSGEGPIANWEVHLSALGLAEPLTTTTNSAGEYVFSGLCTNIFLLTQTVPPPWFSTGSSARLLIAIDGNNYTNVNFFNAQRYNINGNVFLDDNGDGIKSGGEGGYEGVVVILIGNTEGGKSVFRQIVTPSSGDYSFTNLAVGSYKLLFSKVTDYRSTTANAVNIDLNNNQNIDYGLTPANFIKVGGACNDSTLDISLVIDISGSMTDNDPSTGRPKIDVAKEAAIEFSRLILQNLPSARISVVQFSGSDDFDINNTGFGYLSSVISPLTSDLSQLTDVISNITTHTFTCVQCGVKLANKVLEDGTRPDSQKIIVFLTDGLANHIVSDPGWEVDTYYAEDEAMVDIIDGVNNQNIIYHTIGLGTPGYFDGDYGASIDEIFLQAVANINWGLYYNNPTNGDLDQIYNEIASNLVPTGSIIGMVFNDRDLSGSLTAGDTPIEGMPIALTGTNLTSSDTTVSEADGTYGFYGLCDSEGENYTVTENPFSPWLLTTTGSYTINIEAGAMYQNNNFGNRYGFSVSGSIFNDVNKNSIKDPGESNYTGGITMTSNPGTMTVNPDGSYSVDGILPGNVVVSYTSAIPDDFILINPLNGPPPSFLATVGPACSVVGSPDAICNGTGDISNLNFAISNSIPWMQTYGLDLRFDSGITNKVSSTTTCGGGPYASGTDSSFSSPGIIFSGDSSVDFGQGSSSITNWVVGGISYPEVFSDEIDIKTSSVSLIASAEKAGITVESLDARPNCQNPAVSCNLNSLTRGFYHTTGDLRIDSNVNFSNGNYVIVVDGDINIENGASISVNTNAVLIISAGGDINIDRGIHAAANSCPVPQGQLQGIYSADNNIIIEGNSGDCSIGADTMLNIDGTLIANAGRAGGGLQNQRDLCGDNPSYPSLTIKARPDFILNVPGFITQKHVITHEETP